MSELDLFATAGDGLTPDRFGITEDGRVYVEAPAYARALKYSSTQKCLQVVDDEEKGQLQRLTPGGTQMISVIYEDGIWELIFRSTLPSAKAIKSRVKAILRELRQTGVVDTRPAFEIPKTYPEALELAAKQAREIEAKNERIGELEPAAKSWTDLAEAVGDYSLREAAQILDRDPGITTGQNRLAKYLRNVGWVDLGGTPFQRQVDLGRLSVRASSYEHPKTHEQVVTRQVRIMVKGLHELHKRMGGSGPLLLAA